ncbi:50S ribosomal protein L4 [Candidatus Sumerlaeota bacterium]|nr:50S ribosomal protein L4 [Candidatus Sumerlaeota bacterium]
MPVSVEILTVEGVKSGTLEVSDRLLDERENQQAVRAALDCYMANQRQGDASTRTRGEVSGGGRKPWKQKGTGHARAGSTRSPLWRHGGASFGPKPRDYGYAVNSKVRRLAYRSALSGLRRAGRLIIVDQIKLPQAKTRSVVVLREKLGIGRGEKALILTELVDGELRRAAANLGPNSDNPTRVLPANNINIHDVLCCDYLVMTAAVLKSLEETWT